MRARRTLPGEESFASAGRRRGAPPLISRLPGDERRQHDRARRASAHARRVRRLRESVGWNEVDADGVVAGLSSSLYAVVLERGAATRSAAVASSGTAGSTSTYRRDRPARAPGAGLGRAHHGGPDALRGGGGSGRAGCPAW